MKRVSSLFLYLFACVAWAGDTAVAHANTEAPQSLSVPEPATMLLLSVPLIVFGARSFRKKKRD